MDERTPVHVSAQRKHFLWDTLGVLCQKRLRLSQEVEECRIPATQLLREDERDHVVQPRRGRASDQGLADAFVSCSPPAL